jgi:mono/diheme cytochrome c family protein
MSTGDRDAPSDLPARSSAPLPSDPAPERDESFDLEPSVERLHRPILREPGDPAEGRERVPWWLWTIAALSLFWGGWYLGRTGGTFDLATHVAYSMRNGRRDATVTETVGRKAALSLANPVERGQQIFSQNCQACHQADGRGLPGVFPPVVGSEFVTGSEERLIRILLDGLEGPIQVAGATYKGAMPAWGELLNDADIASTATYLRQWAPNSAAPVSPVTVATLRAESASRQKPWTADELRSARRARPSENTGSSQPLLPPAARPGGVR